jgi:toxin secretion/phage lysis holin
MSNTVGFDVPAICGGGIIPPPLLYGIYQTHRRKTTMDKVKLFFIAVGTALSSWLGILATPVYILFALNIVDYVTGLVAAPQRGETRSSYRSVQGIAKKVCTILLVGVAAIIDWLLMYAAETIGIKLPVTFVVASLAAVWLICNEIISILENIGDIGAPIPPFLQKMVEFVKKNAEKKGEIDK